MKVINRFLPILLLSVLALFAKPILAQDHGDHSHDGHAHAHPEATGGHEEGCGDEHDDGVYDPVATVMHHIADANEIHIVGDIHIPLPVFLYSPEKGWTVGTSSMFDHGHKIVDGYVMNHGRVNRIADASLTMGEHHLDGIMHKVEQLPNFKDKLVDTDVYYACSEGQLWKLDSPSTLDGGVLGGGITSFYDFSITKNVFSMFVVSFLLIIVFLTVAKGYRKNEGKAPTGLQSFMEPFFTFIRDEVTIPMIGQNKYERFQPLIMTIFFFVLFCNLLGLVPFFPGGANITGNLGVTLVLAIIAFVVTNINGNKHYWEHIFWMPGIPAWVKTILTPVEILGLFIKPFSLMIRLFANITGGHIIILSLVGLIFVFGESGKNLGGAVAGVFMGGLFTVFMNLIEVLVAFLQAFIFAILTASYIGAAVEEHEHHDHDHEAAH